MLFLLKHDKMFVYRKYFHRHLIPVESCSRLVADETQFFVDISMLVLLVEDMFLLLIRSYMLKRFTCSSVGIRILVAYGRHL